MLSNLSKTDTIGNRALFSPPMLIPTYNIKRERLENCGTNLSEIVQVPPSDATTVAPVVKSELNQQIDEIYKTFVSAEPKNPFSVLRLSIATSLIHPHPLRQKELVKEAVHRNNGYIGKRFVKSKRSRSDDNSVQIIEIPTEAVIVVEDSILSELPMAKKKDWEDHAKTIASPSEMNTSTPNRAVQADEEIANAAVATQHNETIPTESAADTSNIRVQAAVLSNGPNSIERDALKCTTCNQEFKVKSKFEKHFDTKKHQKQLEKERATQANRLKNAADCERNNLQNEQMIMQKPLNEKEISSSSATNDKEIPQDQQIETEPLTNNQHDQDAATDSERETDHLKRGDERSNSINDHRGNDQICVNYSTINSPTMVSQLVIDFDLNKTTLDNFSGLDISLLTEH